ncbi:tyrosine-type recombinase/integrase [Streptoalloteichus tenebrarius]|uniref:tyrosine-type recombinase/integrase n=1 Tax=Streptoalloteichus tenebrarius (strain ATCC 17920 / DSM 40477 / JCM 4838 / CBS 697.72 / NBRC 16177 / NCIMB 11028 / NRRL B-12390 / A12253. 1 / ISP 5477) TaxID=1933 RepID=UPI0027E3359B|nr:site-specific integrase [Streptoalloteichus tenebrarius]
MPTIAEIRQIEQGLPENLKLAVWLMAGAGLRVGEAMAVSAKCVRGETLRVWQQMSLAPDPETGRYVTHLAPLKHRAEGDYRDIPIPKFLREKVKEHIAQHGTLSTPEAEEMLFRTKINTLMSVDNFRHHWDKAVGALKLAYTPHDLRHYFASTALHGGVALNEVSAWLGHKSIKTTVDIYGHLTQEASARMRRVMQEALSASPVATLPKAA